MKIEFQTLVCTKCNFVFLQTFSNITSHSAGLKQLDSILKMLLNSCQNLQASEIIPFLASFLNI